LRRSCASGAGEFAGLVHIGHLVKVRTYCGGLGCLGEVSLIELDWPAALVDFAIISVNRTEAILRLLFLPPNRHKGIKALIALIRLVLFTFSTSILASLTTAILHQGQSITLAILTLLCNWV
jgi:hypothetical protein